MLCYATAATKKKIKDEKKGKMKQRTKKIKLK